FRLDVEIHDHGHLSVRGVERVHVIKVVHAAHLLLDRRRHGLLDGLRVRADIVGLNLDFGWSDVGKLRYGNIGNRHCADDDHQDRDHHRDDGAANEEVGHDYLASFGFTRAPGRTFIRPSVITRCPGCRPSLIIQSVPTRSPALTFLIETVFWASTTATW